jgi:hypothetical protein
MDKNVQDWIAIVGQYLGAFGTIAIVVYTVWSESWRRPKLILSFDDKRDVKTQINSVGLPPSVGSRCLRVRVKNANRRKAAKNCQAFLIGLEKLGSEARNENGFQNDVRQLGWMHDPPGTIKARDLLPGVEHWVDVVDAVDGQPALRVWVSPPWSLANPGDYVFTVQVSAEDANPEVIKVRVRWDGTWQSLHGLKLS